MKVYNKLVRDKILDIINNDKIVKDMNDSILEDNTISSYQGLGAFCAK